MDKETIELISLIEKQFLCCTPMNKFQWNITENRLANFCDIVPEIQKKIVDDTVYNKLVEKFPIKKSYQKAFLKLLINELETSNQEVHENLYASYCLLVFSDEVQSQTQYRHFLYEKSPSDKDVITLEESVNFISQGTTGLCTWQAGLGLAEWCLTNNDLLAGNKILELGCGVGFTGLAVVRNCAPKEYIFSDSHPAVITMLNKNIAINCPSDNDQRLSKGCNTIDDRIELELDFNGVKIQAIRLPWEEINDDDLIEANRVLDPDIVLAADVVYDESCFKSLTTALQYLLRRKGVYAVVAYTVRNEDTVARFTQILRSCGLVFHQVEVPVRKVFIHADETPIRIMKIVSSEV